MINLTIDGQALSVPKGTTVYHAAARLRINIPIFCYHDRMPPFGACRMCLVQVEKMGKLQASCTLECTEGMVVHTQSGEAVEGRKSILELLLINHPLDCPICDRGGECPLQDQTLEHGPGESRFLEEKRHFKKALPLGPVLMLDRERCITCARCTRFGDIVAGDHALEFIQRGYRTEVGTLDGLPVRSKFIGNTITICPVGALTSQVYRFRARPWDNDATSSTCTLCPVGCSMFFDSRDGEIMRTRAREDHNVNDVWLCDKGWFGYEFAASSERLDKPLVRRRGILQPVEWEEALDLIADKLQRVRTEGRVAAFGGAHLTIEENYLFQKLMREVVGVNHLDFRIGMPAIPLDQEGIIPGMEMSIGECQNLSHIILLGVDLTEEFPLIWLRLKAALNQGAKLFFAGHYAPEIASQLEEVILHSPGQELALLDNQIKEWVQSGGDAPAAIFVGRQYLANSNRRAVAEKLLAFRSDIPHLKINVLEGRANSMGARLAGMHPELAPLGKRLETAGLNALEWLATAEASGWDFLYVAGSNPAAKFPLHNWEQARSKLGFMVVQDLFLTESAKQADVVLPAFCHIEKSGHFQNIAGNFQSLQPGKQLPEGLYSDGEIFTLIASKMGFPLMLENDFMEFLTTGRQIIQQQPSVVKTKITPADSQVPYESQGQLFATLAPALFDGGMRMRRNAQLAKMTSSSTVRLHPEEAKKRGLQSDCQVELTVKGKKMVASLTIDRRVALGALVVPLGFDELPVGTLFPNYLNGEAVEIRAFQSIANNNHS